METEGKAAAVRSSSARRRGRPGLLLGVWVLLLGLFAGVAPIAQQALGVPFELFALVMLAPVLASTVVLVRPAWMPTWWSRASALRVTAVTAGALLTVVAFVVTLALLTERTPSLTAPGFGSPLWLFLMLQTIGVLSEEVGWRGVVQRAGEQFARPIVVSAVAGFLFGATHLGYWALGPAAVLTFAFTAMLMSLTITTLFDGNLWQRMIPATVVHLGVNLAIASLARADEPLATMFPALAAAAVMLVVAAVGRLLIQNARRSGRRHTV